MRQFVRETVAQLVEVLAWFVLALAVVVAAFCILLLGTSIFEGGGGPHGYGVVLPIIGLVLVVMPAALIGWALVSYAKRRRSNVVHRTWHAPGSRQRPKNL